MTELAAEQEGFLVVEAPTQFPAYLNPIVRATHSALLESDAPRVPVGPVAAIRRIR